MPTVADLRVRFSADTKDAERGIRKVDNELDKFKKNTKGFNLGDMFNVAGGNLLASGIQTATSALMGFGRAAAGVFVDVVQSSSAMNAQISGIAAVLQLTGEEADKVKGLINQLGVDPNLKVNAQEAADAIDMLARNGLNLEQILNGAARATVFLANATGGSFEASANVATSVMQMFGIEAENMMDAVNGITSVTVASKFSLDDYSLAISQAGGVAANLGVEFEDFNTVLAATSASFASGSDAGTSFKTFIGNIVPQSNEASTAMAQLGLYSFNTQNAMAALSAAGVKPLSSDMNSLITQLMKMFASTYKVNLSTEAGIKAFTEWSRETGLVQNAFYDANGALKSMADISAILAQATANLTEEEENRYLKTIFGQDAIRTAMDLAKSGVVIYTDLATASKELGISQEELSGYIEGGITKFEALQAQMAQTDALDSAKIRVNNLAGDMEIFGGIIDAVKVQLGDKLEPTLRILFQSMTAGLTAATPQILAFGDSIATGLSAALVTITNFQTQVTTAMAAFQTGGFTGLAQSLAIPQPIIDGITFASDNIVALQGAMLGLGAVFASGAVVAGLTTIGTALAAIVSPIGLITIGATLLGAAWTTNFGGIQEKTAAAWGVIQPILTQLVTWVQTTLPAAFAGLTPATVTFQGVFTQISTAAASVSQTLSTVFGPSLTALQQSMTGAFAGLSELSPKFAGLQTAIGNMVTAAQPLLTAFGQALSAAFGIAGILTINLFSTAFQNLPAIVGVAIDQLTLTFNTIATTLTSVVGIVTSLLQGDFGGAWQHAQTLVTNTVAFMTASLTNFSTVGQLVLGSFKTFLTTTFGDIASLLGIDDVNAKLATLRETIANFFTGEGNVFDEAFQVIVATPEWLASLLSWTWPDIPSLTSDWWPSVPSLTADWWPDIPSLTADWWPSIPMPEWVTSLLNWSPVVSVSGAVSGVVESAADLLGIGNNANGTDHWKGGWTWVGEKGPELVNLPKGAQVFSNQDSMGMVGQLAGGTTSAPATGGNFFDIVKSVASNMGAEAERGVKKGGDKAAKKIRNEMEAAAKKMRSEMESALQGVPGLFGTSQVTDQQMKYAELGIPQNFADDYVRRLTDEVINGVDWEGVDISDAAARAGIDPNLPAEIILEMFKGKWADSSLFAGGKNTDLINQQAVQDFLAQKAAQKSGKEAIMALFGVTPEEAQGQAVALGTSLRSGVEQGLTTTTGKGAAGATSGILTGLTTVDPEQLATVGSGIVDELVTEMGKEEYGDKIGAVFTQMFTGFLERKEALTNVGAAIMTRISESLGNAAGIDMVGRFATAFSAQIGLPDSIDKLHDVGARILEYVFQGYAAAAKERDWPAATVKLPSSATTTTTPKALTRSGMAQAGAGGTTINVYANVSNGIDVHQLAYQVSDIMQKRSRR